MEPAAIPQYHAGKAPGVPRAGPPLWPAPWQAAQHPGRGYCWPGWGRAFHGRGRRRRAAACKGSAARGAAVLAGNTSKRVVGDLLINSYSGFLAGADERSIHDVQGPHWHHQCRRSRRWELAAGSGAVDEVASLQPPKRTKLKPMQRGRWQTRH